MDPSKFLTGSPLRMELPFTKMEKTGKAAGVRELHFFHVKFQMPIRRLRDRLRSQLDM